MRIGKIISSRYPGGVLSGKVGTGMCGPDRVLFRSLRFSNGPFLFENWFRYRSHFCKMHNFCWIFPFSLPIGCQKVLMHPNLYGKKYWLVLKRVLQEANGLVSGLQMRLPWFCYRVVVETSGRTSVPNPKLSTPPPPGRYIHDIRTQNFLSRPTH